MVSVSTKCPRAGSTGLIIADITAYINRVSNFQLEEAI
jgi:hypothetical protein